MEAIKEKVTITDAMRNDKWDSLIRAFNNLIENNPKPDDIKEDLLELKNMAKNSGLLTPRQVEGIVDRCNNYEKGIYGVDAVKNEYLNGK